jgi:hypothetical protein
VGDHALRLSEEHPDGALGCGAEAGPGRRSGAGGSTSPASRTDAPAGSVGNVPAFCCAPGMDAVAMTSARVALSHRSAMSESFARTAMDQTRRFNRRYTASC